MACTLLAEDVGEGVSRLGTAGGVSIVGSTRACGGEAWPGRCSKEPTRSLTGEGVVDSGAAGGEGTVGSGATEGEGAVEGAAVGGGAAGAGAIGASAAGRAAVTGGGAAIARGAASGVAAEHSVEPGLTEREPSLAYDSGIDEEMLW